MHGRRRTRRLSGHAWRRPQHVPADSGIDHDQERGASGAGTGRQQARADQRGARREAGVPGSWRPDCGRRIRDSGRRRVDYSAGLRGTGSERSPIRQRTVAFCRESRSRVGRHRRPGSAQALRQDRSGGDPETHQICQACMCGVAGTLPSWHAHQPPGHAAPHDHQSTGLQACGRHHAISSAPGN